MGTPDSIYVADPKDAERFKNGAGIPMLNVEMQTKTLFEPFCNTYYIFGGKLYGDAKKGNDRYKVTYSFELIPSHDVQGTKLLMRKLPFPFNPTTTEGWVYCPDKKTKPVLALGDNAIMGYVQERYPWCEWKVKFVNGVLVEVEMVRVQTRQDVIDEVKQDFGDVLLADDHPVAAKHFWELGFK
jgi:hypothetical protein